MSIRVVSLPEAEPDAPRRVAVGFFDGVHMGHRAVIDGADTVLTFDPHPLAVLRPEAAPKMIMSAEMKRDVLAGLGVEELVVIPFDREFSKLTAAEFIDQVLVDRLGAEWVSVGENFRFGAGAEGDAAMLASRQEFETRVAPLVEKIGVDPVTWCLRRGRIPIGFIGNSCHGECVSPGERWRQCRGRSDQVHEGVRCRLPMCAGTEGLCS